jgi:periplasmic divalent cation tolerance protein
MPEKNIVILSTTSSAEEAGKIAEALLEARKAACVNIVPKIISRYWWQGKIEHEEESLLIIKTKASVLDEVAALIKRNHSYETPEVVAIPITGGSANFLEWLGAEVK